MQVRIFAFIALFVAVTAAPWNSQNDPSIADASNSFVYNLNKLPLSYSLPNQPWSDTYWPSYESGIAHRWNSNNPQDFNYNLYTKEQLQNLTQDVIATLSPAEKFDIFNARYDYPTVHSEWSRTSPDDATWEGLCHGWSPAALGFSQPNPATITNQDNIQIPFGSSDVKALLTYWTAEYDEQSAQTWFLADRCNYDIQQDPSKENISSCADVNAGAYHVVIANLLGNQHTGFVVDRDRSIQVWNQPVFAFNSTILSTDGNSATVSTTMSYGKETYPQWDAHPTYVISETYQYTLELDNNGNVVGGSHQTWDRVDFQWMVGFTQFSGYFSTLLKVYQASTNGSQSAADFAPHVLPSERPNHHVLVSSSDSFGVDGYSGRSRSSWSIAPSNAKAIEISFSQFDTQRYRDKVKIYEGAQGEGALIAVLHGNQVPQSIVVRASSAYVVFTSDSDYNGAFKATYNAL